MTVEERRYEWIVPLRAFAAMAVVLLHTIHGWIVDIENPWGGEDIRWLIDRVLIDTGVRFAVPTFVLITGFLLLNPDKEIGIRKILKYVMRMAAVLMSIGYIYCLMELIYTNGIAHFSSKLILAFRNLLEGKCWDHM